MYEQIAKGERTASPLKFLENHYRMVLPGDVNIVSIFSGGSGIALHSLAFEILLNILGYLLTIRVPVMPDGGTAVSFTAEVDVIGGADCPDIYAPVTYDFFNSCQAPVVS